MAYCCYVYTARHAKRCIYITTYKWRNNNVIITPNVIATLFWRNGGVIVTWHDVYAVDGTHIWFHVKYIIIVYIYYYHTYIMQISIHVINNMPEPGRNLAADACMGRTQLSPCIYNFSTRTIRASRNAMPAWYFFHAEPLISRFSLEEYIALLQQLWQTVLMWNLYPIFISLNQLAVKITPAESFLWMHLHQFQYLSYHTSDTMISGWLSAFRNVTFHW